MHVKPEDKSAPAPEIARLPDVAEASADMPD
jgi:hypothetical protein